MAKKRSTRARHDRWADWAVIGVFALALLLGWGVMAYAEGQRETYTDEQAGLTVRYPQGWFVKSDEQMAFQVQNSASGPFRTTYQVRVWPIDATAPLTPTLASVLNDGSLSRAQEGTAYRLFDITEGQEAGGRPTMESSYVYVVEGNNVFVQHMPAVVEALDVALARGDKAYVFSLLASEAVFEAAKPAFRRFVESAKFK